MKTKILVLSIASALSTVALADGIQLDTTSALGAYTQISGSTTAGHVDASQTSFATGVNFANTQFGYGDGRLAAKTSGSDRTADVNGNYTTSTGATEVASNLVAGTVIQSASGGSVNAGSTGTANVSPYSRGEAEFGVPGYVNAYATGTSSTSFDIPATILENLPIVPETVVIDSYNNNHLFSDNFSDNFGDAIVTVDSHSVDKSVTWIDQSVNTDNSIDNSVTVSGKNNEVGETE